MNSNRIKRLVRSRKKPVDLATQWRTDPIPPRASPFPKSRVAPANGAWRSLTVSDGKEEFLVLTQAQDDWENYKSLLAVRDGEAWQVLVRLEYHGSHPGLHIHDWCGESEMPSGPRSMNPPSRRPDIRQRHRHRRRFNRATFWHLTLEKFGVALFGSEQGDLL